MKKDKDSSEKSQPQQRPEDADRQNAQQEREYRKQQDGSMKNSPEQPTGEDAVEKYNEIKSEQQKKEEDEEE